MSRTVPQAVFDSKEALAIARKGTADAKKELSKKPAYALDEGNPNHPMYGGELFGYPIDEFLAKQYR